jgi:hypothetical protein
VTPEGLRVLAERADAVVGRPDSRLDEVHARIAASRRRRAAVAGAVAVVLVLALTAGLALLALEHRDQSGPVKPAPSPTATPSPTVTARVASPSVRRLTYARGHRIHWGGTVLDVGQTVQAVGATDDGVVFVRGDDACPYQADCRTLWFTDGTDTVRMGVATGSWIRGFNVWLGHAGSIVVWAEASPDHPDDAYAPAGEYVVYDTALRREVGRFGSSRTWVLAVGDGSVFWLPRWRQCIDFYGECASFTGVGYRFDTVTGRHMPVSSATYWAVRAAWPRTLMSPQIEEVAEGVVVRPPHANPKLDSVGFRIVGDRLTGDDGTVPVTVRLARTGQPLRLRVPPGLHSDSDIRVAQWLDDEHVVIGVQDPDTLLVCPVPTGRCRVAFEGRAIGGFGGRG